MRKGRIRLAAAIALLVGFWVLRGVCSSPGASPHESRQTARPSTSTTQDVEAPETLVELAAPPSTAGTISPTGLLRRLYPSLWMADGFCWQESEAAYDAGSPRIDTGLDPGADPPADLLEFFERRGKRLDDYRYRWFNRNQLLFMRQELVVSESGRRGPGAAVTRTVRRESPDGRQFWEQHDAAAVHPCD